MLENEELPAIRAKLAECIQKMGNVNEKFCRRRQESEELQRVLEVLQADTEALVYKVSEEKVDAEQHECKYEMYIKQLDQVEAKSNQLTTKLEDVIERNDEILSDLEGLKLSTDLEGHELNLNFKRRIQGILQSLQQVHKIAKALFASSSAIFASKSQYRDIVVYKPVPGDDVDQLFAQALQRAQNVQVSRLGGGNYLFGSKKIYCKILNGRLVVRVGGGYMAIEQFIDQYGQNEADKHSLNQEVTEQVLLSRKKR